MTIRNHSNHSWYLFPTTLGLCLRLFPNKHFTLIMHLALFSTPSFALWPCRVYSLTYNMLPRDPQLVGFSMKSNIYFILDYHWLNFKVVSYARSNGWDSWLLLLLLEEDQCNDDEMQFFLFDEIVFKVVNKKFYFDWINT